MNMTKSRDITKSAEWDIARSQVRDSYEKIVITLADMAIGQIDGIKHLQAWQLNNEIRA